MRRLLIWVIFVMIPTVLCAQNRTVRGFVYDVNNQPLHNVTLTPEGGVESYKVDSNDGSFAISISYNYSKLVASCEGYISAAKYIDGSYLIFVLEVDKEAVERARREKNAEERARKEAEEKARKEAERQEQERLAAERAAIIAAAKAEKERLAAEEKARKEEEARIKAEAEAKAKAEREARLQAEREEKARLAAEEKARKEEEARLKAEADAKAIAKRKAANQAADKAYDERFKNKGLEHSVDISYAYQLSKGEVAFVYSGYRNYGSTHPVELDYTLSYKFNRIVSVGVGVGVLYHLKSIAIIGDDYISAYSSFKEKQVDVPVFANVKIRMLRSNVRPLISLQGGYYCLSGVLYGEAGLGCEYRVTKGLALQLTASVRTCPWPHFIKESGYAKYDMSVSPCIKLGVNF